MSVRSCVPLAHRHGNTESAVDALFPQNRGSAGMEHEMPFWCFESTLTLYLRLPGNIQGAGKDNDILCWYKCKKHIIFL